MSDVTNADARDVLRRARVWGATTMWIGVGPTPIGALADHVVWTDNVCTVGTTAATDSDCHASRLVLRYHLLWELTHVCLEHPGLLRHATADCDEAEPCVTCADEGRIGEVIEVGDLGSTRVRTARGIETIDTSIVVDVGPGDLVLIHAGAAIAAVP
jgi:hypothetical protein